MQNSQINRVIKLVRKTGDKVVLLDNESDAVMMLMGLEAYEKMLQSTPAPVEQLTEEELMERINRDVAVWRAYNDKQQQETLDRVLEKNDLKPLTRAKNLLVETAPEMPKKSVETISGVIAQEDSASDIIAEEDEEKFYLEPVE
jgi:hypothetical protein